MLGQLGAEGFDLRIGALRRGHRHAQREHLEQRLHCRVPSMTFCFSNARADGASVEADDYKLLMVMKMNGSGGSYPILDNNRSAVHTFDEF